MAKKAKWASASASSGEMRVLLTQDIVAIDEALSHLGPEGQIHLVVQNGRLQCIRTVQSEIVARRVRGDI